MIQLRKAQRRSSSVLVGALIVTAAALSSLAAIAAQAQPAAPQLYVAADGAPLQIDNAGTTLSSEAHRKAKAGHDRGRHCGRQGRAHPHGRARRL